MGKRLLATLSDTTLFLQEWLVNPQRTGSVVPSSRQLAAAMARWLNLDPFSWECRPAAQATGMSLFRVHATRLEVKKTSTRIDAVQCG